jgi:hypothetical protein
VRWFAMDLLSGANFNNVTRVHNDDPIGDFEQK